MRLIGATIRSRCTLHFKHIFREDLLRIALDRLQHRYSLLQSTVQLYMGQPYFALADDISRLRIPLHVLPLSYENQWQDIMNLEMNTRFKDGQPIMRCVLLLPPSSTSPASPASPHRLCTLILTVSHDAVDGKSTALLFSDLLDEYIALYRRACELRFIHDASIDLVSSSSSSTTTTTRMTPPDATIITPEMLHCAEPSPKHDIPPPVDNLLPWWLPKPLYFAIHMVHFLWCHTFLLVMPGYLPYSASPTQQRQMREQLLQALPPSLSAYAKQTEFDGQWTSAVLYRSISADKTAKLVQRAKREGATVGCYVYSLVTNAVAEKVLASRPGAKSTRVWGVMLIDMRPFALLYGGAKLPPLTSGQSQSALVPTADGGFDNDTSNANTNTKTAIFRPNDVGVFISTIDYCNTVAHGDYTDDRRQWALARKVRADLTRGLRLFKHLTSVVFAQYLSVYAATLSRFFLRPHPCPSYSVSNLGVMDAPGSLIHRVSTAFPHLHDAAVAVNSSCSFPMPLVTTMTFKGELRLVFSYTIETMSREYIEHLADLCETIVDHAIASE